MQNSLNFYNIFKETKIKSLKWTFVLPVGSFEYLNCIPYGRVRPNPEKKVVSGVWH